MSFTSKLTKAFAIISIICLTYVTQSVIKQTIVPENASKSNNLGRTNYIRSNGYKEAHALDMNSKKARSHRKLQDGIFGQTFLLITLPAKIMTDIIVNAGQMLINIVQDPTNTIEIVEETFVELTVDVSTTIVETAIEVFNDELNNFMKEILVAFDPVEFPIARVNESSMMVNDNCTASFNHTLSASLFGLSTFELNDINFDNFFYRDNVMSMRIAGEMGSDGIRFDVKDNMTSLTNCSDDIQYEISMEFPLVLSLDMSMTGEVDDTGFNISVTNIDFAKLGISGLENSTVTMTGISNPEEQAQVEVLIEDGLDQSIEAINDFTSNPNEITENLVFPIVFELPIRFPF